MGNLTLTRTNLTGLTSVRLGAAPVAFAVQSATQATATLRPLLLSSPAGTTLSTMAFSVTQPSSNSFFPSVGTLTTSSNSAVDVGNNAAPAVCDLDGDNLLDLLLGQQDGTLRRYEQTTPNGTVFGGYSSLTRRAGRGPG